VKPGFLDSMSARFESQRRRADPIPTTLRARRVRYDLKRGAESLLSLNQTACRRGEIVELLTREDLETGYVLAPDLDRERLRDELSHQRSGRAQSQQSSRPAFRSLSGNPRRIPTRRLLR